MRAIVVGGGIAGVSAAAALAPHGQVTLLEREPSLAYHTTGRSAATFLNNYGGKAARPLAAASYDFLANPPRDVVDAPLLTPRGVLWIASSSQMGHLEEIERTGVESGAGSRLIDAGETLRLLPKLDPDYVAAGIYEPTGQDIDVAGLHQAFVRMARSQGATIRTSSALTTLERDGSTWLAHTGDETLVCDVVVNAAGAWGDEVAGMAGVSPIGLRPLRRTAFMVPGDLAYKDWPLVVDVDEEFYFRPDGVQLLCSLAEEELSPPTDPKPRLEDVALAIERINHATTLAIRTVNSEWTGLRTFAPDRHLVIGEEPTAPGFYWLVGQGGIGIMTAPACAALLVSQILDRATPATLLDAGVDPVTTSPDRFR